MIEKNVNINKKHVKRILEADVDSKRVNILDSRFYSRNGNYYHSEIKLTCWDEWINRWKFHGWDSKSRIEFSKVVTTSWLYRNWNTAPFLLKTYLTIAVAVLPIPVTPGIAGEFVAAAKVIEGIVV